MLVGLAPLPLSFPPSGTQAFYIITRPNCLNICNTVYINEATFIGRPVYKSTVNLAHCAAIDSFLLLLITYFCSIHSVGLQGMKKRAFFLYLHIKEDLQIFEVHVNVTRATRDRFKESKVQIF